MARINEMRMPTWANLGLNFLDEEGLALEKKSYFKDSKAEKIAEVEEAFSPYRVGLSDEINEENEKYNNYTLTYNIEGTRDTETINLELNKDNDTLVSSIEINANEGSKSSFIVSIFDDREADVFLNSKIRLNLKKNSKLKLILVTNLGYGAINLNSIGSVLEEEAFLDLAYIEVGAGKSLVNIDNILKGDRSKLVVDGAYFKEKEDFLDLLVTNEHFGEDTDSSCYFNGALKDEAVKNFKGVVDLRRGCHKANGKIGDYSMMLSDSVINKSAPILLNEEKEVEGNHAASVGRLNKDMLFYIMTRGFSKKQAEAMMLEANFSPAIDKIEDDDLREQIKTKVHKMNTRG